MLVYQAIAYTHPKKMAIQGGHIPLMDRNQCFQTILDKHTSAMTYIRRREDDGRERKP